MRITESAARRQNARETLHGILASADRQAPPRFEIYVQFVVSVPFVHSVQYAAFAPFFLFVPFVVSVLYVM